MSPKIVVVGSLNIDLIARASRIPSKGETALGNTFDVVAGGKGANQAVATARLGGRVTMVGCVGDDSYGRSLIRGLRADRVITRFIRKDKAHTTGVALITVDDQGENSIVVIPGANWQLTPEDVEAAASAIEAADALILQLETPLECVLHAARLAHKSRVPVILNPAPARTLPAELLGLISYLVPNESEAGLLSGVPVVDGTTAEEAANQLRQMGPGTVIITMGSRGALVSDQTGSFHVPAFPVTPVDTTAAGDAFVAGLSLTIASGRPLQDAVRIASAAGALATTKAGAQPSLPTDEQVQQLLGAATRQS